MYASDCSAAYPRYNLPTYESHPGARLGPYEIQSPLGAGGMGEVYRARDTRLDRTVAIKILPTHLSSKPESKLRFDREGPCDFVTESSQHLHVA